MTSSALRRHRGGIRSDAAEPPAGTEPGGRATDRLRPEVPYGQPRPVFLPPPTPPEQVPVDGTVRVLAGPGRRLGASALDIVLVTALALVIFMIGVGLGAAFGDIGEPEAPAQALMIAFGILALLCMLLCETVSSWKWDGPPGKPTLDMRVVRTGDGRSFPPSACRSGVSSSSWCCGRCRSAACSTRCGRCGTARSTSACTTRSRPPWWCAADPGPWGQHGAGNGRHAWKASR